MKKILGLIAGVLCTVSAYAQTEFETKFMRFYVPDCIGSPFPTPVDTYFSISEKGEMFIKVHANFSYNTVESSYFQEYAIPKGNDIYLKLDNDDIITLKCQLYKEVKDGFVTTENGVYQNYAGYSYFPIGIDVSDKLKKHNVLKIRGAFKFEIMDGSMQFTPDSDMPNTKDKFIEAINSTTSEYNLFKNKGLEQEILKQNPLHEF